MVEKQELKVNERMELPSGVQSQATVRGRIDTRDGETFRSMMAPLDKSTCGDEAVLFVVKVWKKKETKEGCFEHFPKNAACGPNR
jgi:hypothetical protein